MALVNFEVKNHIAVVQLDRARTRNAMNAEMIVLLAEAWARVKEDDDIRVAIVTGVDSSFCSGADLGSLMPLITKSKPPENQWEKKIVANRKILTSALLRDYDTEKPIIAAVNGHAVAGGMEMLMGTDIRLAVPEAKLGVQEVKWALFPGGGSTVRLPKQLPYSKAMELLLTGDLIQAEEAYRYGFINHIESPDCLLDKAFEIAEKISANGPIAVRAIRKSVRACLGLTESEALPLETATSAPVWSSRDAKEGPKAFMEKRTPRYTGS